MNFQEWTASDYGINAGRAAPGAAGHGTPASSGVTPGDKGLLPWHPDSPLFWLALFAGATLMGWAGAEFGGRVGPAKGQVKVGNV